VKKVIEDAGPEPMKAITINDKIMAIPFTGATKEAVSVLWVREDWLKKLNLSVPQSMNDVLAISEAFTNKDPDGNGKNDTYGLALDKEFYRAMGLMNGFHAYKGIWLKDASGKLAYSSIQPEMKTALSKLQEMFKSGQIDKEFGVKDLGKVNESFGTNKIGMFFGDIDSGTAPLRQQTPDVKWISLPVPSVDSKPTLLQHSLNINNGFWVVKKGVKNPEAILKMAEVWINMFYLNTTDEMYKKYVVGDGVSYWINSPIKLYKTFKNAGVATNLAPLLNSGKKATDEQLAKLTPEEKDVYGQLQKYYAGDKSFLYREAKFGLQGSANVINQYVKNNQFKPDQFIGTPPPAMAQKFANLQKLELEMFTKIVLGSASISEFDDFVAQWKKLGGEEITNELNQK
jgi:putative aldouronate transport system substrate-binding protein